MRTAVLLSLTSLTLLLVPTLGVTAGGSGPSEEVQERFYDQHGRLIGERGIVESADGYGLGFDRWYWLVPAEHAAKPDNPGGGNGNGGGKGGGGGGGDSGSDPGTDCESDSYKLTGFYWTGPYSAYASSYADVFDTAAQTWDDATSADIFTGISPGSTATAGVQDFVNQIDFTPLSSELTIAVTTTWYYRGSGEAVESDAQYNTFFDWATDGNPDAMDVQAIATHELGHTFGMDHPNGPAQKIGCLTMYAYGDEGSTHERTLGDGDILGIQALYGA